MSRRFTDSQRAKLYAAENEAFSGGEFEDLMTENEARELIVKVWSMTRGPGYAPGLRVSKRVRVGGAWYYGGRHQILFNPERILRWVVIHEVAHALERNGAAHGPEFARAYLGLVERAFGFEAREKLGAAFRKHKVRSHGTSKEKKRGTGPKRETKRAKADQLADSIGLKIIADDWNRHYYDLETVGGDRADGGFYGLDHVIDYLEAHGGK